MNFSFKKYILLIFSLFLICILFQEHSEASRVFRNAYISFEMPDSWKCSLEQTEWVCRSEQATASKEAIIILTAKEVGPSDSFPLYTAHLNSPISIELKGGGAAQSKVIYKATSYKINDQMWIDGLHLGSEVPSYYTRYLATIKKNISILVTLSAHKLYYQKYSQDFFNVVKSLRVIAAGNISDRPSLSTIGSGNGGLLGPGGQSFPADLIIPENTLPDKKSSKKAILVGLALILGSAGIYFLLKSKNKKT